MNKRYFIACLTCLLVSGSSYAGPNLNPLLLPDNHNVEDIQSCFAGAASAYSVNPAILMAIAKVESNFDIKAQNQNVKGAGRDIGIMQINSRWIPKLQKHGVDEGVLNKPCVNIYVGAWVLKGNQIRYGETWRAVGAYHASSRRPDLRKKYAMKVNRALHRLSFDI